MKKRRRGPFHIASLLPKDFDDVCEDEARYIEAVRRRGMISTEETDDGKEELFSEGGGSR